MYVLLFRIFEQLALALKNRIALKIFTVFFIIQDFWATTACPENRVCPKIFQARGCDRTDPPTTRLVRLWPWDPRAPFHWSYSAPIRALKSPARTKSSPLGMVENGSLRSWQNSSFSSLHAISVGAYVDNTVKHLWEMRTPMGMRQWCSNVLARGPHLSFRNPSRATRIITLITNSLKILLND